VRGRLQRLDGAQAEACATRKLKFARLVPR